MQHGIHALVVDDSEINLIVAQELLRSQSIEADLAGSGATAAEMCKLRRYDIILMDHLMPEMDGIEAAKIISSFSDTPIVAMTANEEPSARDLYMANGFAGFLQKPLDVSLLSDLMMRLIPKKRPHKGAAANARTGEGLYEEDGAAKGEPLTLPNIAQETGLDVQRSVSKLGGSEKAYLSVLKLFAHTGPGKIEALNNMLSSWNWKEFLIAVHGQKSALANIGATALSEEARVIESAVRDGKHSLVEAVFLGFYVRYMALCDKLRILYPEEALELREATEQDHARLKELLAQVMTYVDDLAHDDALATLAPVLGIHFGEPLTSGIVSLQSAISAYNYDGAAELIKRLLKGAS
ncbi:MAG: response regulator [Oscillospiraceae bacterium]|nr:response regulator [Oscillospiraceae bacterium]